MDSLSFLMLCEGCVCHNTALGSMMLLSSPVQASTDTGYGTAQAKILYDELCKILKPVS